MVVALKGQRVGDNDSEIFSDKNYAKPFGTVAPMGTIVYSLQRPCFVSPSFS